MSNEFIDAGLDMVPLRDICRKTVSGVVLSNNGDQVLIFFDDGTCTCLDTFCDSSGDAGINVNPTDLAAAWFGRLDLEKHLPPSVMKAIDRRIRDRRLQSQRLEDESERREYERLRAKFEEGGA